MDEERGAAVAAALARLRKAERARRRAPHGPARARCRIYALLATCFNAICDLFGHAASPRKKTAPKGVQTFCRAFLAAKALRRRWERLSAWGEHGQALKGGEAG